VRSSRRGRRPGFRWLSRDGLRRSCLGLAGFQGSAGVVDALTYRAQRLQASLAVVDRVGLQGRGRGRQLLHEPSQVVAVGLDFSQFSGELLGVRRGLPAQPPTATAMASQNGHRPRSSAHCPLHSGPSAPTSASRAASSGLDSRQVGARHFEIPDKQLGARAGPPILTLGKDDAGDLGVTERRRSNRGAQSHSSIGGSLRSPKRSLLVFGEAVSTATLASKRTDGTAWTGGGPRTACSGPTR
jgi:hypothetical protein